MFTVGDPLPGNHNNCTAFDTSGAEAACGRALVVADGGYQGTSAFIPHRRSRGSG